MTPSVLLSSMPPCRDLAIEIEDMPPEIEAAWRDLLPDVLPFVQPGVRHLSVGFDSNRSEALARVENQSQYRRCRITVCNGFLWCERRQRLQALLHELAHVWVADFHLASIDALRSLTPDSGAKEYQACAHRLDHEEERLVEDLSFLFLAISEGRIPRKVDAPR